MRDGCHVGDHEEKVRTNLFVLVDIIEFLLNFLRGILKRNRASVFFAQFFKQ